MTESDESITTAGLLRGRPVKVSRRDLADFADAHRDLADPDVMSQAWE
jgi:hypothetical protein